MSDDKNNNGMKDRILEMTSPDNIQKYFLGFKKSGHPRAVYDVIKDYTRPKKKKKNKKNGKDTYGLYLQLKKGKKGKKKDKHWHI